jgi:murein DD-endopeptidase MepM/ murein hydrolase activator NlpD
MTEKGTSSALLTAVRRGTLGVLGLAAVLAAWGAASGDAVARPMRVWPSSAGFAHSMARPTTAATEAAPAPVLAAPAPPRSEPSPARCGTFRHPVDGALTLRTAYRGPGKNNFKFCPKWSSFGPVRGRVHGGVDISATTGSLIFAAADGTVEYAHDPGGYGFFARLKFREEKPGAGGCTPGAEVSIIYAHLLDDPKTPHPSRVVKAGDIVGRVGCSGNAKGMCSPSPESHVHVTVERGPGRQRIDPGSYLGWSVHVPEQAPPGQGPCR